MDKDMEMDKPQTNVHTPQKHYGGKKGGSGHGISLCHILILFIYPAELYIVSFGSV